MEKTDTGPGGADSTCEESRCAENFTGKAIELRGRVGEEFAIFREREEAVDDSKELGHGWEGGQNIVGEGTGARGICGVKGCAGEGRMGGVSRGGDG